MLEEADNNTKLHIYYGDILSGEQGAISAEVVNLNVIKKLYMEDKTFRFTNPVDFVVTAEDGITKKTYKVSVEVLANPDAITSIDIDNKITEIKVGSSHTFIATINGFGNFDKSVSWKIQGETSKNTTINNNGTLIIGEDESSKVIKVIATASGDSSKTIEITINVIQNKQLDKVTELL